jgi:hypothetical protein
MLATLNKYDIYSHMVLNVTMVTFPMTLLMNKFTNTVINDGWVHPFIKTLLSFCQQPVMKYCHGWSMIPKNLNKEWYIIWVKSTSTLPQKGMLSKCALKGSKHALNLFRVGTTGLGLVVMTHGPQWGSCGFHSPCQHGAHHHSPPNYDGGSLDIVVWVPQNPLGRYHVRYFQGTSG